ncbi:MAG: hypothetical protein R6U78_08520 [Bacteroidales bacterium]
MKKENQTRQDHYEILVHNAQKGSPYLVKLVNDPKLYLGIPMIDQRFDTAGDRFFTLKVLHPQKHKGVYKIPLEDIEMLQSNSPL